MTDNNGKDLMLYWAAVFLIIAIVGGVLGISGVAIVSKQIACEAIQRAAGISVSEPKEKVGAFFTRL